MQVQGAHRPVVPSTTNSTFTGRGGPFMAATPSTASARGPIVRGSRVMISLAVRVRMSGAM